MLSYFLKLNLHQISGMVGYCGSFSRVPLTDKTPPKNTILEHDFNASISL